MNYIVSKEDAKKRLDIFLLEKIDNVTRSYIKNIIENGKVLVNGKIVKSGYSIKTDDKVQIEKIEKEESDLKPQKMDIDIVYEDDDVIIINKAKGVSVHPRKWKSYRNFSKWFVIFT